MRNRDAIANLVGAMCHAKPTDPRATPSKIAELEIAWKEGRAPASDGDWFSANDDVQKIVDGLVEAAGGKFPIKMSLVSITDFNDEYGPINCPLFKVGTGTIDQDGKPACAYVDNLGARYENSDEFIPEAQITIHKSAYDKWYAKNRLPDGAIYVDGHYLKTQPDAGDKAARALDATAAFGCTVGGVALFMVSDGTAEILLPLIGTGEGWLASRNIGDMIWRAEHHLSNNPFTNRGALRLWLRTMTQVTASVGGIAAPVFGAAARAGSQAAARGLRIFELANKMTFTADMAELFATTWQDPDSLTAGDGLQLAYLLLMIALGKAARQAGEAARQVEEEEVDAKIAHYLVRSRELAEGLSGLAQRAPDKFGWLDPWIKKLGELIENIRRKIATRTLTRQDLAGLEAALKSFRDEAVARSPNAAPNPSNHNRTRPPGSPSNNGNPATGTPSGNPQSQSASPTPGGTPHTPAPPARPHAGAGPVATPAGHTPPAAHPAIVMGMGPPKPPRPRAQGTRPPPLERRRLARGTSAPPNNDHPQIVTPAAPTPPAAPSAPPGGNSNTPAPPQAAAPPAQTPPGGGTPPGGAPPGGSPPGGTPPGGTGGGDGPSGHRRAGRGSGASDPGNELAQLGQTARAAVRALNQQNRAYRIGPTAEAAAAAAVEEYAKFVESHLPTDDRKAALARADVATVRRMYDDAQAAARKIATAHQARLENLPPPAPAPESGAVPTPDELKRLEYARDLALEACNRAARERQPQDIIDDSIKVYDKAAAEYNDAVERRDEALRAAQPNHSTPDQIRQLEQALKAATDALNKATTDAQQTGRPVPRGIRQAYENAAKALHAAQAAVTHEYPPSANVRSGLLLTRDNTRALVEWFRGTLPKDTPLERTQAQKFEQALMSWIQEQLAEYNASYGVGNVHSTVTLRQVLNAIHERARDVYGDQTIIDGAGNEVSVVNHLDATMHEVVGHELTQPHLGVTDRPDLFRPTLDDLVLLQFMQYFMDHPQPPSPQNGNGNGPKQPPSLPPTGAPPSGNGTPPPAGPHAGAGPVATPAGPTAPRVPLGGNHTPAPLHVISPNSPGGGAPPGGTPPGGGPPSGGAPPGGSPPSGGNGNDPPRPRRLARGTPPPHPPGAAAPRTRNVPERQTRILFGLLRDIVVRVTPPDQVARRLTDIRQRLIAWIDYDPRVASVTVEDFLIEFQIIVADLGGHNLDSERNRLLEALHAQGINFNTDHLPLGRHLKDLVQELLVPHVSPQGSDGPAPSGGPAPGSPPQTPPPVATPAPIPLSGLRERLAALEVVRNNTRLSPDDQHLVDNAIDTVRAQIQALNVLHPDAPDVAKTIDAANVLNLQMTQLVNYLKAAPEQRRLILKFLENQVAKFAKEILKFQNDNDQAMVDQYLMDLKEILERYALLTDTAPSGPAGFATAGHQEVKMIETLGKGIDRANAEIKRIEAEIKQIDGQLGLLGPGREERARLTREKEGLENEKREFETNKAIFQQIQEELKKGVLMQIREHQLAPPEPPHGPAN